MVTGSVDWFLYAAHVFYRRGGQVGLASRAAVGSVPALNSFRDWRWRRGEAVVGTAVQAVADAYFGFLETVRRVEPDRHYAVKARGLADWRSVESTAAAFAASCTKGYRC